MLILKVKNESDTGHKLDAGRITIGRDPSNDIVLDDDSVSGFHAQILVENDTAELIDLGSTNGTCISGKPISGRQRLAAWQKLRFGSVEAEVQDPSGRRPTTTMAAITDEALAAARGPASAPPAEARQKASRTGTKRGALQRLRSNEEFPESIDLHDTVTVGRDAGNDLCLPSTMVSSRHARIEWRQDAAHVEDLGSTNGTWVNGKRVQSTRLASGDRIAFDEIEYVFKPVETQARTGTTVNPAIGARAGGTTVRPAVDRGSDAGSDAGSNNRHGSSDESPGRSANATADRPAADPDRTRPSTDSDPGPTRVGPSVAKEKSSAPDRTRVQPAAQAPKRAPQKARPRQPAPPQSADTGRNTPPNRAAATPAPAPAAQTAPERPATPQKPEKPQPQQVIVKQKGSGCMIAMMFIIMLVVALPLMVFVFKVGFLIAIFNEIKSFFGL